MNISKLIRYIFVGGLAYLAEMLSLYLLHNLANFSAFVSVAVSFWVGFVIAFMLQKIVTFNNREKHFKVIAKQIVLYSLLVAFNYGFSLIMVAQLGGKMNVFVVRTITILIITCWNFYIYNMFIFNNKASDETS